MDIPQLIRKRFVPPEEVELKDDILLYQDEEKIITKWKVFRPKKNFSNGVSCYFLKKGWKISKFLQDDGTLYCYYCDMIETEYQAEENRYIFSDLLADVVVMPDQSVRVLDLDEIAECLEDGSITAKEAQMALKRLDTLLQEIYEGRFSLLTAELEREYE